jgi:hypothetical protein
MQVAAAVVQVIKLTLIGQGQRFKVAQLVILVFQQPGAVCLAEQLTEGIVGLGRSVKFCTKRNTLFAYLCVKFFV